MNLFYKSSSQFSKMHVVYYCHYMYHYILFCRYLYTLLFIRNVIKRTYNKQLFHMLHAITLRYLNIFVKVNFWENCYPPPLKKFIMIIIFIKFTKNRSLNSLNPGGTLNPSKKDLFLGLANAKQTNKQQQKCYFEYLA